MNANEDACLIPKSSETTTIQAENKHRLKGQWLVFTSLILAILLEVLPTEADILFVAMRLGNIPLFLAVKAAMLGIILLPLLVFFRLNGYKMHAAVSTRLKIIAAIVIINLIMNSLALIHFLSK